MQAKEQQFKELFLSEYGRMYKAAYILLGDEDEAKDVVQDIFAKLWAGTAPIKEESKKTFLLTCVRNRCLNIIAQRQTHQESITFLMPAVIESEAYDEKYGAPEKLNKPEFSFNLNSWFVLGETAKALLQVNYTGRNHWGLMYRGSNFFVNARLQKSFLKGCLSATLYANDIFHTAKNKVISYYAVGQTAQDDYHYTQCVGITLSYNFNASTSKYKGTGAGNEERNRL